MFNEGVTTLISRFLPNLGQWSHAFESFEESNLAILIIAMDMVTRSLKVQWINWVFSRCWSCGADVFLKVINWCVNPGLLWTQVSRRNVWDDPEQDVGCRDRDPIFTQKDCHLHPNLTENLMRKVWTVWTLQFQWMFGLWIATWKRMQETKQKQRCYCLRLWFCGWKNSRTSW